MGNTKHIEDVSHIECYEKDHYPDKAEWTIDNPGDGNIVCHFGEATEFIRDSQHDTEIVIGPDDAPKAKGTFDKINVDGSDIRTVHQEGYDSAHHMWGQLYIGLYDALCTVTIFDDRPDRAHCGQDPTQTFDEDDFDGKWRLQNQ